MLWFWTSHSFIFSSDISRPKDGVINEWSPPFYRVSRYPRPRVCEKKSGSNTPPPGIWGIWWKKRVKAQSPSYIVSEYPGAHLRKSSGSEPFSGNPDIWRKVKRVNNSLHTEFRDIPEHTSVDCEIELKNPRHKLRALALKCTSKRGMALIT